MVRAGDGAYREYGQNGRDPMERASHPGWDTAAGDGFFPGRRRLDVGKPAPCFMKF